VTFSDTIVRQVKLDTLETVKNELVSDINGLRADGGTALFDAMSSVLADTNKDTSTDRIRAVIILSDGADTASNGQLNQVLREVEASRSDLNPVIVIPVAYGSNADIDTLSSIARASSTTVQSGDPKNITKVLEIISSYF
jgi:Ca-activated chloride channel family protein